MKNSIIKYQGITYHQAYYAKKDDEIISIIPGFYISEDCQMIYLKKYRNGEVRLAKKKSSKNNCEYQQIRYSNEKDCIAPAHRILACTFIPGYFKGAEIDHIDHDRSHNEISNLRWVTHSENMLNKINKNKEA